MKPHHCNFMFEIQAGPCSNLRLLLLTVFHHCYSYSIENQLEPIPLRMMVGSKDMHTPFLHQNTKSTTLCWYTDSLEEILLWRHPGHPLSPDSTAKPSPPLRKCTNHHLCMFHLRWSHWIADTWDPRSSEGTFEKNLTLENHESSTDTMSCRLAWKWKKERHLHFPTKNCTYPNKKDSKSLVMHHYVTT